MDGPTSKVTMLRDSQAFSGFSVDDFDAAEKFYGERLGLELKKLAMGLQLNLAGGKTIFVYQKPDHQPATYTILNFPVPEIDEAVDALVAAGVHMEKYGSPEMPQDEKGILRNNDPNRGPRGIAWFKDPAGNVLSVLQQ